MGGGLVSFRFSPKTGAGRSHRSKLAFDLSQNGVLTLLCVPRTGLIGGWHTQCALGLVPPYLRIAPVIPIAAGRVILLHASEAIFYWLKIPPGEGGGFEQRRLEST